MKKLALFLAVLLFPLSLFATNELDSNLKEYYVKTSAKGKSVLSDEYTWIKRVYVDLAGRIPTVKEIQDFVSDKKQNKKETVVNKILNSEDYVNNFYNFWSDMFRIRPERLSDDVALLKSYPYMDYIRDFIRNDKSYKTLVSEMLDAKGRYTENPATGYMIRDNGMPLDNLATSMQLFIGKDIACAQCHNDPFQDYTQMQFYQMASFFNSLNNRENRKEYGSIIKKVDEEIKQITKKDRIDNNVRQLISANLFNLKDDERKTIKLPHDYKYEDAKPFDVIEPVSLDKSLKDVTENRRTHITEWVTGHEDFPNAIANRIWHNIVGKPLLVPEINFSTKESNEGKLLIFLGNYFKTHNYSIKELIRLIASSDFYQRTAYVGNDDDYKFQSILVKRMSAYQIWDSLLTLVIPDVNYTRISFSEYSKLIELNWDEISGQDLLYRMDKIREYESGLSKQFLKYKNIDLVRSSYIMNKNSFVGHFLKEYGSSDRILIDSSNDKGSITQVLTIMNSPLVDLLIDKKSQIYQSYHKNLDKNNIFLSILGRPSSIREKDTVMKAQTDDLVWALVNSREFIFRK